VEDPSQADDAVGIDTGKAAFWYSADGRSRMAATAGEPPGNYLASEVSLLTGTGDGFVALGDTTSLANGDFVSRPVCWMSADGRSSSAKVGQADVHELLVPAFGGAIAFGTNGGTGERVAAFTPGDCVWTYIDSRKAIGERPGPRTPRSGGR
jgi:hypothetical protein